jgi:hypothetical protein
MKDWLSCFWEEIKSLINRLSTRVVTKPNLLCKVRFEVFRNIINYYWNKTKPVNIVIKVIAIIQFILFQKNLFESFWPFSKTNIKPQTTNHKNDCKNDLWYKCRESIQLLVCKEEIKILLQKEFSYFYHSYCNRLVIIIRNSWFG